MPFPVTLAGVNIPNWPDDLAPLLPIFSKILAAQQPMELQQLRAADGTSSKKIAVGTTILDGSNPTPVATGLNVVEGAVATMFSSSSPEGDPTTITVDFGGLVGAGLLHIYAWKPTAADNTALIASTDNAMYVSWIAYGS